jgi:hypothetical protein
MTISSAMDELIEKVRELGVGDYFDGMDYDEIIEMGLYYYGKHIEDNLDGIMEDMEIGEVDSESFVIEALPRTVVYTLQDGDIDPDTGDTYLEDDDEGAWSGDE